MKKSLSLVLFMGLLALLVACDQQPATPTPVTGPMQTTAPLVTVAITPEATPEPTPAPTTVLTDTLSVELGEMLTAQMTPTPVGSSDGSHIEGVYAFRLRSRSGSEPMYVAHTYGMRSFDPEQKHWVSVHIRRGDTWQELSRLELDLPDYVDRAAVTQVQIDPAQSWMLLEGGAGAHGSANYLLRFDGKALHKEVEANNALPGSGEVRDLNGDGMGEMILDESDAYVFCYACSVRLVNYGVLRWNGARMVRVELAPLSASAPEEARRLNDLAIKEANGELWKAAREHIEKAKALAPDDETLTWNAALIGITAAGREAHIKDSGHALLATVFYGDYDAAIARIRQYSPEELFGPQSPLIAGTPAEGDEGSLRKRIIETTTKALEVEPDIAGALFLRGWAQFEAGKDSSAAAADIKRAADLNPKEELFGFAAAYLTNK